MGVMDRNDGQMLRLQHATELLINNLDLS